MISPFVFQISWVNLKNRLISSSWTCCHHFPRLFASCSFPAAPERCTCEYWRTLCVFNFPLSVSSVVSSEAPPASPQKSCTGPGSRPADSTRVSGNPFKAFGKKYQTITLLITSLPSSHLRAGGGGWHGASSSADTSWQLAHGMKRYQRSHHKGTGGGEAEGHRLDLIWWSVVLERCRQNRRTFC